MNYGKEAYYKAEELQESMRGYDYMRTVGISRATDIDDKSEHTLFSLSGTGRIICWLTLNSNSNATVTVSLGDDSTSVTLVGDTSSTVALTTVLKGKSDLTLTSETVFGLTRAELVVMGNRRITIQGGNYVG